MFEEKTQKFVDDQWVQNALNKREYACRPWIIFSTIETIGSTANFKMRPELTLEMLKTTFFAINKGPLQRVIDFLKSAIKYPNTNMPVNARKCKVLSL